MRRKRQMLSQPVITESLLLLQHLEWMWMVHRPETELSKKEKNNKRRRRKALGVHADKHRLQEQTPLVTEWALLNFWTSFCFCFFFHKNLLQSFALKPTFARLTSPLEDGGGISRLFQETRQSQFSSLVRRSRRTANATGSAKASRDH